MTALQVHKAVGHDGRHLAVKVIACLHGVAAMWQGKYVSLSYMYLCLHNGISLLSDVDIQWCMLPSILCPLLLLGRVCF